MAVTFEPIATTTLSVGATTITFSSIPNTYTDLRVVFYGRNDASVGGGDKGVRLNNDASSLYYVCAMYSNDGAATASGQYNTQQYFYLNYWGSTFSVYPQLFTFDLFNYTSTTQSKAVQITLYQNQNATGRVERHQGLWNSTAAVNRWDFINISGPGYAAGTTATLYGIKAA